MNGTHAQWRDGGLPSIYQQVGNMHILYLHGRALTDSSGDSFHMEVNEGVPEPDVMF